MARPPKGKPLTYRPIRLDDDVWKECQRLGKEHGTINEGMAVAHGALKAGPSSNSARIGRLEAQLQGVMNSLAASQQEVERLRAKLAEPENFRIRSRNRVVDAKGTGQNWKRGPREKGDKTR